MQIVIIRELDLEALSTMTPDEIEAALQSAFAGCDAARCPLSERQKEIMRQIVLQTFAGLTGLPPASDITLESDITNPLDELTDEERQSLLQFVRVQQQQNPPWKTQLLNDWLHNRDSGAVQFIRTRYGPQWLNRLEPVHLNAYASTEGMLLQLGDRIQVSNGLWEWVQESGPCSREWFPCTVIRVDESGNDNNAVTKCIVRFTNGAEYEIQGVYDWNRYNWRWPQD